MPKITVALLFGGQNSEHEVSLTSAVSVLQAIDRDRFAVVPIWITKSGAWLWIEDFEFLLTNKDRVVTEEVFVDRTLTPVVLDYAHSKTLLCLDCERCFSPFPRMIDAFFPIIHGLYGEDGTIQGLFRLADRPFVGCGVMASAVGLDKLAMKAAFAAAGLPLCRHLAFTDRQWQRSTAEWQRKIAEELGFPCFVKPANGGSSVGVVRVAAARELTAAVEKAREIDAKIVVEEGIAARELECGVLGNDEPQASVVGEVVAANEFYDYDAKYYAEGSKTIAPADIPSHISDRIREMAITAFSAIDGRGYARVDFLWKNGTDSIYINEINTIPGFTAMSMFPMLWRESGVPYSQLITRLVELALKTE